MIPGDTAQERLDNLDLIKGWPRRRCLESGEPGGRPPTYSSDADWQLAPTPPSKETGVSRIRSEKSLEDLGLVDEELGVDWTDQVCLEDYLDDWTDQVCLEENLDDGPETSGTETSEEEEQPSAPEPRALPRAACELANAPAPPERRTDDVWFMLDIYWANRLLCRARTMAWQQGFGGAPVYHGVLHWTQTDALGCTGAWPTPGPFYVYYSSSAPEGWCVARQPPRAGYTFADAPLFSAGRREGCLLPFYQGYSFWRWTRGSWELSDAAPLRIMPAPGSQFARPRALRRQLRSNGETYRSGGKHKAAKQAQRQKRKKESKMKKKDT